MSAKNYSPPLRIEIRTATPTNDAPWLVLDVAQTDQQAFDKLKRHKIGADAETRVAPNDPLSVIAPPVVVDTAETKLLLEQYGIENMTLRRENNSLAREIAELKKKNLPPAAKLDALAGETPLPFEPGDLVRDVHTGGAVKVTEINPPHPRSNLPRPGFAYESIAEPGKFGFVPLASVGCYVKVSAGAPAHAEPTGVEAPPPVASAADDAKPHVRSSSKH